MYIYMCVCIRLQARSPVPTPKRSRGVSPRAWLRFCRASLQAAAEPAERSLKPQAIRGCNQGLLLDNDRRPGLISSLILKRTACNFLLSLSVAFADKLPFCLLLLWCQVHVITGYNYSYTRSYEKL